MGTRPTEALALMSQQYELVHVILNKHHRTPLIRLFASYRKRHIPVIPTNICLVHVRLSPDFQVILVFIPRHPPSESPSKEGFSFSPNYVTVHLVNHAE